MKLIWWKSCLTAQETVHLLHTKFLGHVISRVSDQHWVTRSWGLTPLNYFVCGLSKWRAYANKQNTVPCDPPSQVIHELPLQLFDIIIIKRLGDCRVVYHVLCQPLKNMFWLKWGIEFRKKMYLSFNLNCNWIPCTHNK